MTFHSIFISLYIYIFVYHDNLEILYHDNIVCYDYRGITTSVIIDSLELQSILLGVESILLGVAF